MNDFLKAIEWMTLQSELLFRCQLCVAPLLFWFACSLLLYDFSVVATLLHGFSVFTFSAFIVRSFLSWISAKFLFYRQVHLSALLITIRFSRLIVKDK